MFCSHWQSSHHTFEEDVQRRLFHCSLLSSCYQQHLGNTTFPIITNSGSRICLPDPFKRRPCSPACGTQRRFCHGRCVYGGSACLFGPCTASPYREGAGYTCSQLAMEAEEDECRGQCGDISTGAGAAACQQCLTNIIDPSCQLLSGADCWYCGGSILEKWRQCSSSDLSSVAMIDCISQAIVPSCRSCICTLFCYWSPTGDLCKSCLDQPQLASLFLHHQHCPQGWVYSEASSSCLKTFNQEKPWSFAKSFCENGGGALAQPKTTSTIQAVLEAVNLLGAGGLHWLGGQQSGEDFLWVGDNSVVDSSNWAQGFPVSG